ncbi:MAG: tyrosine-type recombinase/integrase [Saccharofermentans sp.]|nr:tyrosine-type recombinase/integrase [Saccharofermentans sp.]
MYLCISVRYQTSFDFMLRHTFATRMREAGADIKATADIMGHTESN